MVPTLLHQTWKDEDVPERFRGAVESWRTHQPGWTHRLWTDGDLERFVRKEYPEVWPVFRSYPDQIQRVDAARYMILHRHGGVYADLDIACVRTLDDLRHHRVVLPRTTPLGLSNDLMMAEPDHPLFWALIEGLAGARDRWQRRWVPRHFRVLLTTGSLYLTNVHRARDGNDGVHLLEPDLYSSQDPGRAYVLHLPGNTWAGPDTRALTFVHRNWRTLAAAFAAGAFILGFLLLR